LRHFGPAVRSKPAHFVVRAVLLVFGIAP
jgi:hypothetical protein